MKINSLSILFFLAFFLILFLSCNRKEIIAESKIIGKNGLFINTDSIHLIKTDSINLQEGIDLFTQKRYDRARNLLLLSSKSRDIAIRTQSFLYLNSLEVELRNYAQALVYLEEYHRQAMMLYHQAVKAEKEIQNHKVTIYQAIEDFDKQQSKTFFWSICLLIGLMALIGFITIYFYQQRKHTHVYLENKQNELDELNRIIELNQHKTKKTNHNAYLLQANTFMKTPIYEEITELGKQKKDKNIKILTYNKQDTLKEELDRIFDDFIQDLKDREANLTENDIKLCCLSLLPLTTLTKALCYGSTEINIIKQRKHQIKKKLANKPENLSLFEFIFATRKEDKKQ